MTEQPDGAGGLGGLRGRVGARVRQLLARANAAWERNEYAAALVELREVLSSHPDFPDVRNRAGLCRAMLGDTSGALEEFDHAVRINPEYGEAYLNRALVLNELGRFDEAREAFARAAELEYREEDPYPTEMGNRIAAQHADLADLYMEADQPSRAVSEYERALEVRPAFVDIRVRLARARLAEGNVEAAASELEQVLDEHPSFLGARLRLGTALRRMGRKEQAISEWRRCLELEPDNRLARAFLASVGVTMEEVIVGEPGPGGGGDAQGESAEEEDVDGGLREDE